MKFRLMDLLQCPSCGGKLVLEKAIARQVSFSDSFSVVKCTQTCAFRKCTVSGGNLKPQDCMECYTREIVEGTLRCECGQTWPISNGIPRFLPNAMSANLKRIQATFSFEWKMFRFGERNWGQDISHRRSLFLKAFDCSPQDLKNKLIFDAGCGSGLLSIEMAQTFGMEVVALDLSFGIEKAYERNASPHLHFVQGSVLEPPLQDRVFDYLYCAGVLVACPDTRMGFKAIGRTLREGGRCFIWVYHPIDAIHHRQDWRKLAIYNWIRINITSRLPIRIQYLVYLSWIPLFLVKQRIEMLLHIKSDALTWREKMQNLFDFFSPIYQHRHRANEVEEWYQQEGFANVHVSEDGTHGIGVRGDQHLLNSRLNVSGAETSAVVR